MNFSLGLTLAFRNIKVLVIYAVELRLRLHVSLSSRQFME
ncbi:hypothetical protein SAMD00020551_1400 [Mesobacillus selenatarsenatis SF-1]|uniref:Uncharacterized protein n=1 Tax=Mesobacillus selenatarsenatis (strain DSM 18680 / JCM 14380 / FERM P-15431 / SF-1) TaxID=1321606 RepID=A0A0A8X2K5_MESS1|nr:hypothetical protein SAMD00020551_1400 [Mesobacillus selenatarsenatis SF-1]